MKRVKGEINLGRFIIPYRVYGNAKKTIICISGAKQTMAAWRSFVSHFVSDYSVVVFDLPGQGRSQIKSGSQGVIFEEQIEALSAVINETNGNGSIIIAAASWGTIIGAAYAAIYPNQVEKMILGSFGVKPTKIVLDAIKNGQALFRSRQTTKIAPLMIEHIGQYIPESHKNQILDQFSKMSIEQFESFYEHCEFIGQANDIGEYIDLKNIKASTLILSGEYDAILDQKDTAEASILIPNCEHRMIEGAGHFLHWERRDILHTYSEFLARA